MDTPSAPGCPATGPQPRTSGAGPDALDELQALIESLSTRFDELPADDGEDDATDVSTVTCRSGPAQENRAIHRSRALLAAERARQAREPLPEILARARDGLERVRRQRRAWQHLADHAGIVRQLDTAVDRVTVTDDPDTVLRGIVEGAVAGIPAVDHAYVTVCDLGGRIVRAAASGDDAARLRAAQVDLDEGPGIDARTGGVTVVVHDLAAPGAGGRWPAFGPVARERGVRSVLAVPLRCGRHTGALTLWSRAVSAFDEPGRVLGELFGRYASIAVDSAEMRGDLRRAIERRDVIGQAKGILMVERGVGPEEAFRILARRSQQENTKVADIARRLVAERFGARTEPRGGA